MSRQIRLAKHSVTYSILRWGCECAFETVPPKKWNYLSKCCFERGHANLLENLSNKQLIKNYRLAWVEIMSLPGLLQHELNRGTHQNFALNPTVQLLRILRFCTTAGFLQATGDAHSFSKPTASKSLHAGVSHRGFSFQAHSQKSP